jgi:hypothetical protein
VHLCVGRNLDFSERLPDVCLCDPILRSGAVYKGVHLFHETILSQIHGFDASFLDVQPVIVHELCELGVIQEPVFVSVGHAKYGCKLLYRINPTLLRLHLCYLSG